MMKVEHVREIKKTSETLSEIKEREVVAREDRMNLIQSNHILFKSCVGAKSHKLDLY